MVIPSWRSVLKPDAVAEIVYVAGGTPRMTYRPPESVVAENWKPFSASVALTWAPETNAPEGSVTVPAMEPV